MNVFTCKKEFGRNVNLSLAHNSEAKFAMHSLSNKLHCCAVLSRAGLLEDPRHEYWGGLPFPPPRDLRDPRIEPVSPLSPASQADSFTTEPPGKPKLCCSLLIILLSSMLRPALESQ